MQFPELLEGLEESGLQSDATAPDSVTPTPDSAQKQGEALRWLSSAANCTPGPLSTTELTKAPAAEGDAPIDPASSPRFSPWSSPAPAVSPVFSAAPTWTGAGSAAEPAASSFLSASEDNARATVPGSRPEALARRAMTLSSPHAPESVVVPPVAPARQPTPPLPMEVAVTASPSTTPPPASSREPLWSKAAAPAEPVPPAAQIAVSVAGPEALPREAALPARATEPSAAASSSAAPRSASSPALLRSSAAAPGGAPPGITNKGMTPTAETEAFTCETVPLAAATERPVAASPSAPLGPASSPAPFWNRVAARAEAVAGVLSEPAVASPPVSAIGAIAAVPTVKPAVLPREPATSSTARALEFAALPPVTVPETTPAASPNRNTTSVPAYFSASADVTPQALPWQPPATVVKPEGASVCGNTNGSPQLTAAAPPIVTPVSPQPARAEISEGEPAKFHLAAPLHASDRDSAVPDRDVSSAVTFPPIDLVTPGATNPAEAATPTAGSPGAQPAQAAGRAAAIEFSTPQPITQIPVAGQSGVGGAGAPSESTTPAIVPDTFPPIPETGVTSAADPATRWQPARLRPPQPPAAARQSAGSPLSARAALADVFTSLTNISAPLAQALAPPPLSGTARPSPADVAAPAPPVSAPTRLSPADAAAPVHPAAQNQPASPPAAQQASSSSNSQQEQPSKIAFTVTFKAADSSPEPVSPAPMPRLLQTERPDSSANTGLPASDDLLSPAGKLAADSDAGRQTARCGSRAAAEGSGERRASSGHCRAQSHLAQSDRHTGEPAGHPRRQRSYCRGGSTRFSSCNSAN